MKTNESKKSALGATIASKKNVEVGAKMNKIANETWKNIGDLNTNRGGLNGFVFEHLHTKELNYKLIGKGLKAEVIDNNGLVDIVVRDIKTGKVVERIQTKCGYETLSKAEVAKLSKYIDDGQTLVINGDSKNLARNLNENGINYKKSNVTNKEVTKIEKNLKKETNLTKAQNAKVVSKVEGFKEIAKNSHVNGVNAAKNGAIFGAGISLGSNFVEVISGDKALEDAAVDVVKDTAIAGVTGYAVGAAGSVIASTTVGSAAIAAVGTGVATVTGAASAAGAAVAGTAIGGVVAGGASAVGTVVAGSVVAGSTAVVGAASAAGAAVAGTAVGGAVVGAATAAGAAVAGTAVGGAAIAGAAVVGAAAVAAAPVVAAGAVIGGVFAIGKKLFGK